VSLELGLIGSLVIFVLLSLVVVSLPALRYCIAIRKLEATCGLGAAVVGSLGVAYALFGSLFESSAATVVQKVEAVPIVFVIVGILLLGPIGVAVSAVQHSRTGDNLWRIVLWVITLALVILTFLTGFSIGLFLFPSTLLALLASAFTLGKRRAAFG
jgi:hypothetical protein